MFSVGLRGSFLLANFWDEDWENMYGSWVDEVEDYFLPGVGFEVFLGVKPIKYLKLQAGLGYSRRGTNIWLHDEWSVMTVDWESEYDSDWSMDYFDITITIAGMYPIKNIVSLKGFIGFTPAIYLDGRVRSEYESKSSAGGGSDSKSSFELNPADVKNFDFGIFIGFGAEFNLGSVAYVTLDVRYNFSLTAFCDDDTFWGDDLEDAKHEYFQFSLGIGFDVA
jgi:hypothetical protein